VQISDCKGNECKGSDTVVNWQKGWKYLESLVKTENFFTEMLNLPGLPGAGREAPEGYQDCKKLKVSAEQTAPLMAEKI